MKNDFAKHLTRFFTEYLSGERGASHNTIRSYGNTFTSFLDFMDEVNRVKADKLSIADFTRKNILSFLQWLQEKNNAAYPHVTRGFLQYILSANIFNMRM